MHMMLAMLAAHAVIRQLTQLAEGMELLAMVCLHGRNILT